MKAPNGAGSVEVLPDGRARIRAVIDGKRRQIGRIYPSEAHAERMLRAFNAERGEGRIEATSTVTLASFGAEWIDGREVDGSRRRAEVRSIGMERSVWTRHVAQSELGRMALASIRTRDVERFALWLRDREVVSAITTGAGASRMVRLREMGRTLSRSMQVHALRLVRGALDEAVRRELLERNAAKGVVVAKGGRAPRDLSDDWLRADEIGALLACEALDLRDRTAYACALGLALRLGDIKRLEVAHVRLDADEGPHVRVWIGKSERWHAVPVMPWLVPWLRRHLASLPEGERFVFASAPGQAYRKNYDFGWSQKLANRETGRGEARALAKVREPSALEVARVARKIRFHDLRGTTATHLALGTWGRRWSLHEIKEMLAHSDQRVTERYVRRAMNTLLDAAKATTGGPGCPRLPMNGSGSAPEVPESVDVPGASRTRDLSLRKLAPDAVITGTCAAPGQRLGNASADDSLPAPGAVSSPILADLARELVAGPSRDAARSLASAYLDADEGVRLALEALDGGPHAVRRAIELAALVLGRASDTHDSAPHPGALATRGTRP